MTELYEACIGAAGVLIGAIIGAIISGLFQWFTTRQIVHQSDKQFQTQMEQTRREFSSKIEQVHEEQKRVAIEKASTAFQAETQRFYSSMVQELSFYDELLNELHYLNNASHPKGKEKREQMNVYPHIDNRICAMVSGIDLHQDIAKLLGSLRYHVDVYNMAVDNHASSETIEDVLVRIFSLIGPINDERFKNSASIQSQLRNHEIKTGQEILQKQAE